MAGNERHARREIAVGKGNARIGGYRYGGGNTGNDFEGNPFAHEHLGFLAPAPENKRVPALQADYRFVAALLAPGVR